MIKIAHVTFDMRLGGAERVIFNLVRKTNSFLYRVEILCTDRPVGFFGDLLQSKGFRVSALGRNPGFDLSLAARIRRHIIDNKIDILHCHQYTPYVYGVIASIFTGCRVVFTEHGRFYPDQRKAKRVMANPLLNLFTSRVTAISSATRDALMKFENFPGEKIDIVYNGIDGGERESSIRVRALKRELEIPEDAFVLGTIARLDTIKNQSLMIRALKRVHREFPGTVLVIVGDGPERGNLERLVNELGLSSNVKFTGFREDVGCCYSMMDIFLLTSFSEGTAMSLLEAMASSLVCIATNVGGNPEIVLDSETGYIIPSGDEKALAERIRILISDKGLRDALGANGRKRYEVHFTVERMVHSFETIYDSLKK